eukprot:1161474-Pelagomonas_calceolata.AAC.1
MEGLHPERMERIGKEDPCRHHSRVSAQVTLHTIMLGVGGMNYSSHTLEPPEELGLDTHKVTKFNRTRAEVDSVFSRFKRKCWHGSEGNADHSMDCGKETK